MKLPAVAIATAFASGAAIGLWPAVANRASSRGFVFGEAAAALLLIAGAIFLLSREYLRGATTFSLAAWLVVGFLASSSAQEPKPKNYILNVIESDQLDLLTPLRWHGTLRDEPAALPWGISYEIELTSVDYQERSIFVQGGLRASYTPRAGDSPLPSVRAGDQVALVAQARLPQLFRDEGAFDGRAYLRSQGIDLTATLRSPELLERIALAKRSPLVFRVKFREHSFLLPGDAETLSEHYMLSEADPTSLQSDVLKVGHHGSKNSTIADFVAAVQHRLAVISSGEGNSYGHPSPQLIERLQAAGVPILRTDTSGAIHILTDGNNLEVSCLVACPEITAQINSAKPQAPQDQQSNQQE